ncbi:MAG: hypothetical protein M1830_005930 [Pleopsidium flavum]|nr:MAG: hypothetical protein M1830_005930 [Pleopsidium flavum]
MAGPRLVLIADTDDFDDTIIQNFKDEGYDVTYMSFDGDKKAFRHQLSHLADPLDLGEKYAIVAYGEAAALTLEACIKPMPKLCTLVAYYPNALPHVNVGFPPSVRVLAHLAGKNHKSSPKWASYTYPHAEGGFAESDLETYEKVSASLAWTRTLGAVRRGFGIEVDLEGVWERHLARRLLLSLSVTGFIWSDL